VNRIIDVITSNYSFLITSHVRLDGDAVGSELALYHLLRNLGKEVLVYNEDETPGNYRFLPGVEVIVHALGAVDHFDAAFVLDCSEISRVGDAASRILEIKTIVSIDHHISNTGNFGLSFTDPGASSVGELLYRLIEKMDVPMTREIAVNLYTAIVTDTGSFRYSNTGEDTFRIAGKLVKIGADPYGIAEKIYENNPKEKIRLLVKVLGTLEFAWDGRISTLWVTRQMLKDARALPEYTENFVDLARSIEGVEVAAFFTEMEKNLYKVSLRSKGRINVAKVAGRFGGGGHFSAAACKIEGDLDGVRNRIVQAVMAG
jgi:bifunctional oligoribonuclease and PAP phosphatase NrnA